MSKQKPNPNAPDFFTKVEQAYQKVKATQALAQHQESVELSEIVGNIRVKLTPDVVEQVREEVKQTIPSESHDVRLIEAEVEARIASVIVPYAKRIQAEQGKIGFKETTNPMQQVGDTAQNRRLLLETQQNIAEIRRQRDKFKLIPFSLLILNMNTATVLSSFLNTNNNLGFELAQSGIQIDSFETLPTCKPKQIAWIKAVYDGKILNDSELNQALAKIDQNLRAIARPKIL